MALSSSSRRFNVVKGLGAQCKFNLPNLPIEFSHLTIVRRRHFAVDPLAEMVLDKVVRKLDSLGLLTTPATSDSLQTHSVAYSEDFHITFALSDFGSTNGDWGISIFCNRDDSSTRWIWRSKAVDPTEREQEIWELVLKSVVRTLFDELRADNFIWTKLEGAELKEFGSGPEERRDPGFGSGTALS